MNKTIDLVAILLVAVGGLNWGLVGLMNLNLVAAIFGDASMASRAVYALVGLSALYVLFTQFGKKMTKQA